MQGILCAALVTLILAAIATFGLSRGIRYAAGDTQAALGQSDLRTSPHGATNVPLPTEKGAHELFVQGMGLLDDYVLRPDKKENIYNAIEAFQRAQSIDSSYAPAYAGLSRAYWRKYFDNPDPVLLEQAIQIARRAVELDPELSMARSSLGFALIQLGKNDAAAKEFERASILDPSSADAHQGLGEVWESRNDFVKAEAFYNNALRLRSSNPEILRMLGNVYYRMGQLEKAEQFFSRSLEIAPDSFKGHSNLAAIFLAQGKHEQAAAQFQRALEIQPDFSTYSNLGTLYLFQGRYADAVRVLEKAVALPGGANDYRMWANLAYAYDKAPGNQAKAQEAYAVSIQLTGEKLKSDPDNVELTSHMAFFLAKTGDLKGALSALKNVDETQIQDPQIHFRNALTFELAGKRRNALDLLGKALSGGFPLANIAASPELLKVHQDPRYRTLAARFQQTERNPTQN